MSQPGPHAGKKRDGGSPRRGGGRDAGGMGSEGHDAIARGRAEPTRSLSPGRAPPCGGWLGSLLGQCCIHEREVVESELREPPAGHARVGTGDHALVESSEPHFEANGHQSTGGHQQHHRGGGGGTSLHPEPPSTAAGGGGRRSKAAPGAAGNPTAPPLRAVAPDPEPTPVYGSEQLGRFVIDNSILKIQGPPGVAYRYTKNRSDKVKNEVTVTIAKWNDIVQGVDEGDGWLRVGKYYLPMTHEGVPVVTPFQDPPPPPAPTPPPAASKPETSEGRAAPEHAKAPVTRQVAPAGPEPEPETPSGGTPPPAAQPAAFSPSAPIKEVAFPTAELGKEVGKELVKEQENRETEVAVEEQVQQFDFPEATKEVEVPEATKEVVWQFRPSVGTWLQVPAKLQVAAAPKEANIDAVLEAEAPGLAATTPGQWYHAPSVGTWLQALPVVPR